MNEHENKYLAVVENHTLGGANTITLMKHKQRCVVLPGGVVGRERGETAFPHLFQVLL